jgi:hypothetical protein
MVRVYTPAQFLALRQFVERLGLRLGLAHRPFVDYYYASRNWCKLYLNMDEGEEIIATYGLESLQFEYQRREMKIGFGTSTYTVKSGAALYLYFFADDSCPVRLTHGGSADTHSIVRSMGWRYYSGVKVYVLNKTYPVFPGDSWVRKAAKSAARKVARSKIPRYASRIPEEIRQKISVREEQLFGADLLPTESPFSFRLAPTVEYLNWRYNTQLSFVRYRLYRVLQGGQTAGYVVLNESPEQLIVAQCDGTDVRSLAYGVLLSLLDAGRGDQLPRSVVLTCANPVMQEIYEKFGFQAEPEDRPFFIGTLNGPADIALDTSNWLINFDWGDNGLRPPFLDQLGKGDDVSTT